MMAVPMGETLAQQLYRKNIELENGLRRSAQSRVPSDPNAWFQMRENYEAIILEDHDFAEKHEVESALWQLHYRRIEEFRAHINGSASDGGLDITHSRKGLIRPDQIKKCSLFKSFLFEATGYYHDLILKIRAKYGLPLTYVSGAPEARAITVKDEKKFGEIEKGIMSCHRYLIFLGDLARYKGLYGEGDSSVDFSAASSYYVQAASLWPSGGNPHHQLAILAAYSGDDLAAVYRYFRSLAVDKPFLKARDNLLIAFEKNRRSYSQLLGNNKVPSVKALPSRSGKGIGRREPMHLARDMKPELAPTKEHALTIPDILKVFFTRFVRLNGILFTRTSLETFGEVFSLVLGNLCDLLSSGPEEELNFGPNSAENGLVIVRVITVLVFSIQNMGSENEEQSYAEIVQRKTMLQNAFSAAFEIVGHILKRCTELCDVASSYLLPGILVFMEWLACHQNFAIGTDVEEEEATVRSFFWNQCISFMNKVILSGVTFIGGDEDTTCFSDMRWYDEDETGNRLALWEDVELRGFLPLVPAQLILDFSRQHSLSSEGSNSEKQVRMKRIMAAGKALMQEITIAQQRVFYDSNLKFFFIGSKPPIYNDFMTTVLDASELSDIEQKSLVENTVKVLKVNPELMQPKAQLFEELEEEEDEEIVFQPTIAEKYPNLCVIRSAFPGNIHPKKNCSESEPYGGPLVAAVTNTNLPSDPNASFQLHETVPSVSLPPENDSLHSLKCFADQKSFFINGLSNLTIGKYVPHVNPVVQEHFNALQPYSSSNGLQHIRSSSFFSSTTDVIPSGTSSSQNNVAEMAIPSKHESVVSSGANHTAHAGEVSESSQSISRKNPVSRPVRHFGPPPGFDNTFTEGLNDPFSKSVVNGQHIQMDDYRWLDGYQSPANEGANLGKSTNRSVNYTQFTANNGNALNNGMIFPFPRKQISPPQKVIRNAKNQQGMQLPERLTEQYQAHSLWSSQFFV